MNNNLFLVIEILGEPIFHKTLNQSGYSGRDYIFFYNSLTRSHIRAYRDLELYRAERVDLHKAANVWPLIPNLLPAEKIEAQCWTTRPSGKIPITPANPATGLPAADETAKHSFEDGSVTKCNLVTRSKKGQSTSTAY